MNMIEAIGRLFQPAQVPQQTLAYKFGPDLLHAHVQGDDIPAMKTAALDAARDLYGPEADLRIECMSDVDTAIVKDRGKFLANVMVRCLNFTEAVEGHSSEPGTRDRSGGLEAGVEVPS